MTMDEALLEEIDRVRRRTGQTRSEFIRDGLRQWLGARRRHQRELADRNAYSRQPVTADEFGAVLAAQPFDDEGGR
jgi:metal-responsive CopG/Arc/MetJ family transcriptional regulator